MSLLLWRMIWAGPILVATAVRLKLPNLDRLAKNGSKVYPVLQHGRCCPTRASLLTGTYPHQAGIGHMMNDTGLPGYKGDLGSNVQNDRRSFKSGKIFHLSYQASGMSLQRFNRVHHSTTGLGSVGLIVSMELFMELVVSSTPIPLPVITH